MSLAESSSLPVGMTVVPDPPMFETMDRSRAGSAASPRDMSMIRKSGHHFSEKIMRLQRHESGIRSASIGSRSIGGLWRSRSRLSDPGRFAVRLWKPLRSIIARSYARQHYPLGYTAALDGLRGLMTFGVVVAHIRFQLAPGAIAYMDAFFVMSGYFITSLLLRDVDRHGGIRFGQFYRRRFGRIVPPLAAMVLTYLLFECLFFSPARDALNEGLIAFTYTMNWWRALGLPGGTGYLGHTWSLSIEEQFYLLWPVTLALLIRWFGVSWRLLVTIAGLAAACCAWRIGLTWTGAPTGRLYNGLDTRAEALMVGCALAVVLRLVPAGAHPAFDRMLPKLAWPLLLLSLAVTFFCVSYHDPIYYYIGITLFGSLPAALLVTMLVRSSGTVMHHVLERPEAVFLGKIFYGVYLWHYPIFLTMKARFGAPNLVRFVFGFGLTLLLATLSHTYIERRFMPTRARES